MDPDGVEPLADPSVAPTTSTRRRSKLALKRGKSSKYGKVGAGAEGAQMMTLGDDEEAHGGDAASAGTGEAEASGEPPAPAVRVPLATPRPHLFSRKKTVGGGYFKRFVGLLRVTSDDDFQDLLSESGQHAYTLAKVFEVDVPGAELRDELLELVRVVVLLQFLLQLADGDIRRAHGGAIARQLVEGDGEETRSA